MNATSTHTKPAGQRVGIVIVDPELRLVSGWLIVSRRAAIRPCWHEISTPHSRSLAKSKPELILLSQDSSDKQTTGRRHTSGRQQALPQAPVLTLNRATPENPPGPRSHPPHSPVLHGRLVEDVLRTQLGIPCMRYSNSASQSSLATRP